ncbi:MAG: hypothetical protein QXD98_02870 [Candidatus Diapherotrites archaeon]
MEIKEKGIIFTADALAATTIIILFLAGISTIERQTTNNYTPSLLMDMNTNSNAMVDFYIGETTNDNLSEDIVESNTAKCNSMLEYDSTNDNYKEKVVKCAKLW